MSAVGEMWALVAPWPRWEGVGRSGKLRRRVLGIKSSFYTHKKLSLSLSRLCLLSSFSFLHILFIIQVKFNVAAMPNRIFF